MNGTPQTLAVPTSVYRYYDRWGILIYVGVTSRGTTRNREHNRDKAWWPYVASQEVDHLPDRSSALAREAELITEHAPPFNTQGNSRHESARSGYLALRDRLIEASDDHAALMAGRTGRLPLTRTEGGFMVDAAWWPVLDRMRLHGHKPVYVDAGNCVGKVDRLQRHGPYGFLLASVRKGVVGAPELKLKTINRSTAKGGTLYHIHGVLMVGACV